MQSNDAPDPREPHTFPDCFEDYGVSDRNLRCFDLTLDSWARYIPNDIDRWITKRRELAQLSTNILLPIHPKPMDRFRSTNFGAKSFGVAFREGSKAALFGRNSLCERYAIQTGYTCQIRRAMESPYQTGPEAFDLDPTLCNICQR